MANDIPETLFYEATRIASKFQQEQRSLETKRSALEVQLRQVTAQIDSFNQATQRLTQFKSKCTTSNWACPDCWVRNNKVCSVVPIRGTDNEERFRCKSCGAEFAVPIG